MAVAVLLSAGVFLLERGHRHEHAQERLTLQVQRLALDLAMAGGEGGASQAAAQVIRLSRDWPAEKAVLIVDDVTGAVRKPVHGGAAGVRSEWLSSAQRVPVGDRIWEVRLSQPLGELLGAESSLGYWLVTGAATGALLSLLLLAVRWRNTHAQARKSYELLQAVIDSLPVPVFVKDSEHRYLLLNTAFGKAFNLDVASLIGRTDSALHDEATTQSRFAEDDRVLARPDIAVSEQTDRDTQGNLRHWIKSKARLDLPEGTVGLCGILTEITAQRQAEDHARAMRDTMEAILDALPQPLCVKNQHLQWILVNEAFARLLQKSKEELVGTSDADYWDAQTVERYWAHDREALEYSRTVDREERVILPDGTVVWLVTNKRALMLPSGDRVVIAVSFDVSELRESNRKLEHTHQFLDAIIDALPHSLVVKDELGHYLIVNRAWCEAVAIDAGQVIGRKSAEIFPPDIASKLEAQDAEAWDTGGTVRVIQPRISLQGARGWSLKSRRVVVLPNGSRYNVQVTTDVTEHQEALQEARRSRELLRGVLDSIPNPLIVKDASRRYILLNAAALGESRHMQVGGTDRDVFPAEIAERYAAEDDLALADPSPRWYSDFRVDASGAERWWVKSKRGIVVAQEERLIVSVLSEVTALKVAERDLMRNQARLRVLNDLAMLMLGDIDLEELGQGACESLARALDGARLTFITVHADGPARLVCSVGARDLPAVTRWTPDFASVPSLWEQLHLVELLATTDPAANSWREAWQALTPDAAGTQALLMPVSSDARLVALLLIDSRRKEPWPAHEMRVAREAAHLLHIACHAQESELARREAEAALRASEAELRRHRDNLQTLVEERTNELTLALRAVEAANRSKTQFFNNMSHELRTPMNAIVSFAKLGLEKAGQGTLDAQTVTQYLQRIDRSAGRLLLLINDLLDLAKLESGRMSYRFGLRDLRRIIEAVCEELSALATGTQVRFIVRCEGDVTHAWCDELRMEQVMRNVLSNALRYAPSGTAVTIDLRPSLLATDEEDVHVLPALEVVVADEGPGIAPGEFDVIFDKYVQGSRTRGGGTGLGLPIAREILRQHGGYIEAANGPEGGARMIITLPLTDPGQSPRLVEPGSPAIQASGQET